MLSLIPLRLPSSLGGRLYELIYIMTSNFRVHLSVFLLAVLLSVILFAFGVVGRGELIYAAAALTIFGEITLLVKKFYDRLATRSS